MTEVIFGARHASPVEFHGSRDAMASKIVSPAALGQELSRKLSIIKFDRSALKLSQTYHCTLAQL